MYHDITFKLKEPFDILGNSVTYFLAESHMRRLMPHTRLSGKYEATARGQLA